jgi:hypothetical protein
MIPEERHFQASCHSLLFKTPNPHDTASLTFSLTVFSPKNMAGQNPTTAHKTPSDLTKAKLCQSRVSRNRVKALRIHAFAELAQ